MKITLQNVKETKQFAQEFVKDLHGGEVIILSGELGAGKTTFVQLVADIFGVKQPVNSPTFTLMQHYAIKNKKITTIHHLDLYRLEKIEELHALGLEELLGRPQTVAFIEWGEKYLDFFKKYHPIILRFSHGSSANQRIVEKITTP